MKFVIALALAVGIFTGPAINGGENYPGQEGHQRYLVLPFASVPEGALGNETVEVIADDVAWKQLEDTSLFPLIEGWKGKRIVLIGPKKNPISCGRHGWDSSEGVAVLQLFRPTVEYPASSGGCAIQAPTGRILIRTYWKSGHGAT